MRDLLTNIRFKILLFSFFFSILVFFYVKSTVPSGTIQTIKLTQIYALTAVFFLYITLLATPLTKYFQFLPYRGEYIKARRALGISVFYFGILHSYLAFFKQLGGFAGLGFLSDKYLLAISLSFGGLLIFTIMALTATDKAIERMGFRIWKAVHRLIYLAGFLILTHALMLGTHFVNLSASIPKIFFVSLAFLLVLEAKRLDDWTHEKYKFSPNFGFIVVLVFAGSVYFLLTNVFATNKSLSGSLGIHSQHILQATKDAQSGIRLSVSMSPENTSVANKKVKLQFKVTNATSGELIKDFSINQEKIMHLIIVDENLDFFDHVHPELKDGIFSTTYEFPKTGKYRLYSDFMPKGMSEQYFAFQFKVGDPLNTISKNSDTLKFEDTVENIKASITLPKDFNAKKVGAGGSIIGFKLEDESGGEVKNIEPYLGAFGHLVMIRQNSYEYIHVHPKQKNEPYEGQTAGPVVEFSPLSIYGGVKPGIYKLFAQFKIDGKNYVFDYLVKLD